MSDSNIIREASMHTILLRYGELALKSDPVRGKFESKLLKNIEAALNMEHEVTKERGRIFIHVENLDEAVKKLRMVFGIVSLSPCHVTGSSLDEISEQVLKVAEGHLKPGESFALRVRRAGTHGFASYDIAKRCGKDILDRLDAKVDLSHPDKEIFIEARQNKSYIYTKIYSGFGGLPLGTQGSVVSLLSGGIDSPVATFLTMKRGCRIMPVHFDAAPLSDEDALERAVGTYRKLKQYSIGEKFELTVFPFGEARMRIVDEGPDKLTCVFCKRWMLKIAERFALENGCDALVTGENLGQVASQTLSNLKSITYGLSLPVFRPLITYDKEEITALAKIISTYETSIQEAICCTARPIYPATASKVEKILETEKKIGFDEILNEVYEKRRTVK